MLRAKRYSNVTFTKRVDHEGFDRKPPRGPGRPAICPSCGAVFAKHRWSHSPQTKAAVRQAENGFGVQVCPSCRRRRTGVPHGYVHLDGEFFPGHRREIEQLLHHEVEHAQEDNPLDQVLGWENLDGGGLLITTATGHLAERLGRALEKAYDGVIHYGFSHENKLAHIWWHR